MKPFRLHLKHANDLITRPQDIRAGLVALALERKRRAGPIVIEAKSLQVQAEQAHRPALLREMDQVKSALLTAAGVSNQARAALAETEKVQAIDDLIERFLEPAGSGFVSELVQRFLLGREVSLRRSMRNIGGVLAQRKLSRFVLATMRNTGIPYRWLHAINATWTPQPDNDAGIEQFLKGLTWTHKNGPRTLVFNLKVPFVGTNVDLLLFNVIGDKFSDALTQPERYVALGELKGGIDPAGADEHWKTATKALSRIRQAFKKKKCQPPLFYIGAAIANNMAKEIWKELKAGDLTNAANLTSDEQLASLCGWLCEQ